MAKEVGQAGKQAADIVAQAARSRVPEISGRARESVRAVVSKGGGGVRGGGAKAPYYGFLDFGNKKKRGAGVGRKDSHPRQFIKKGRYIYPALDEHYDDVVDQYEKNVNDLLRRAGLK